jgi:hypothetical protein
MWGNGATRENTYIRDKVVLFSMANKNAGTQCWGDVRYSVCARGAIEYLMEEPSFRVEKRVSRDKTTGYTLNAYGVPEQDLTKERYDETKRFLDAYLAEKCSKEAEHSFNANYGGAYLIVAHHFEVDLYTCPNGKVGVLKYNDSKGNEMIEVYVGETAWKNVKNATIDEMYATNLHHILYWNEFSKLKEEVENLPE